jgi:hypothetical protein
MTLMGDRIVALENRVDVIDFQMISVDGRISDNELLNTSIINHVCDEAPLVPLEEFGSDEVR